MKSRVKKKDETDYRTPVAGRLLVYEFDKQTKIGTALRSLFISFVAP